jgi:sugar phosphate isomerase/epimerase
LKEHTRWKLSFIPYYMTSPAVWASPSTREAIQVIRRAGYAGVEWMLGQHFRDVSGLRKLVAQTRRRGLAVSNIMCWQDLVTKNDRARTRRVKLLKAMLEEASNLSIPLMNVFTGPMTWNPQFRKVGRDISEGQAWRTVVDSFSDLVSAAEENEVIITVEPVFGMLVHDYYTVREFLSYFESNYLGVNLDPSHFVVSGNDPVWSAQMLGEKVRHVHVKDAFGKPGGLGETFIFPFLGEGVVDWRRFFAALRDSDYNGYLSLEFENDSYLNNVCDGDWAEAAVQLKKRVEKFLPKSNN